MDAVLFVQPVIVAAQSDKYIGTVPAALWVNAITIGNGKGQQSNHDTVVLI